MRNLLALIGTVVVLFVGLGWYFKWYSFMLTPGNNGKQHISVEVDTKKIAEDTKAALSKAGSTIQSAGNDGTTKGTAAEFTGPPLPSDMPIRAPSSLTSTTRATSEPPKVPFQISVPGPNR